MKMLNSDENDNRVETESGKVVNLDDYEDNWSVAHPNDELPPMKSKKTAFVKEKLNKEAQQRGL